MQKGQNFKSQLVDVVGPVGLLFHIIQSHNIMPQYDIWNFTVYM